jgi:hypothetical protein
MGYIVAFILIYLLLNAWDDVDDLQDKLRDRDE